MKFFIKRGFSNQPPPTKLLNGECPHHKRSSLELAHTSFVTAAWFEKKKRKKEGNTPALSKIEAAILYESNKWPLRKVL